MQICLFGCSGASAQDSPKVSGIDPALAGPLAKFGFTFVTGTYSVIAGKSSIDAPTAQQIGEQGTKLLQNYERAAREGSYAADILHGTLGVSIAAGVVGASASTAGVGSPAAVAIGVVAEAGNDALRTFLVKDTMAKASAALSAGLNAMTAADAKKLDELLSKGQYEDAAAQLEKSTGIISKMQGAVSDPEARKLLDDTLQQAMRKSSADQIRLVGSAITKVDDLTNQFTKHVEGVTDFNRKATAALDRMQTGLDEVEKGLTKVGAAVADLADSQKRTAYQVQLIQEVLFDQQPPNVKLALLKNGGMPGLAESERDSLILVLETQVKQQKVLSASSQVVSYARDLNTILGAFGVQDERLTQVVQYGTAATNAMQQAFSGNYLGAVATVAGLFGGSRPDPITQQFERVFQQLAKIDKKLDQVIELQRKTLEGIETLSRQIAELQRRLDYRFDRVDFELARLNSAVIQVVWQGFGSCASAWEARNSVDQRAYDAGSGGFRGFKALTKYTTVHGDKAYRCADALGDLYSTFRNRVFAGNPLSLSLVVGPALGSAAGVPDGTGVNAEGIPDQYGKSALESYLTGLHEPSYKLLLSGLQASAATFPRMGSIPTAYALLSSPSATADGLIARIRELKRPDLQDPIAACRTKDSLVGKRAKVYLCTDDTFYDEELHGTGQAELTANQRAQDFLAHAIVRDQVMTLVDYTLLSGEVRDLARSSSSPGARTLDELASGASPYSYGRQLLAGALMIADASIAQLSMLYGDLTAWFIFNQVWDSEGKQFRKGPVSTAQAALYDASMNLLRNENNPWLKRNVLMLILQNAEIGCNINVGDSMCKSRDLLYSSVYAQYFPKQVVGDSEVLAPVSDATKAATGLLLRAIVALPADAEISTEDQLVIGGTLVQVPRRVHLKMGGIAFTMPDPVAWSSRALSYPPFLMSLVKERQRLSQRLAGYAAFDDLSNDSIANLVSILSTATENK